MNDNGLPALSRSPDIHATHKQAASPEGVSIVCYENDIPDFVESELKNLYSSLHSSIPYPHLRFNRVEDNALRLPATCREYVASLGKPTGKNISGYLRELTTSFPSFCCSCYCAEQIDEADIRRIIDQHRARLAVKGIASGIGHDEERRIIELARRSKIVVITTKDGRIRAGIIAFRPRRNYFSYVSGHDSAYGDLRLGLVSAYRLVRECIGNGGEDLHFMCGSAKHNPLLPGTLNELHRVAIYRSAALLLSSADVLLKHAISGYVCRPRPRPRVSAGHEDDISGSLIGTLRQALPPLSRWRLRQKSHPKRENETWSGY